MKPYKIVMHLGLGDTIACAAIIAFKAKNREVEIPCWHHNYTSVKSLFIELPQVKVIPFQTESEMLIWGKDADLFLGHYNQFGLCKQRQDEDFVQWFYRGANFNIEEKHVFCPIKMASNKFREEALDNEYNFIHDDHKRGFIIKNVAGFRAYHDPSESDTSILEHVTILENAKEIHCIDSSFLHLTEALPTTGKLFYHKYARPNSTDYKYLKKQWTIIE